MNTNSKATDSTKTFRNTALATFVILATSGANQANAQYASGLDSWPSNWPTKGTFTQQAGNQNSTVPTGLQGTFAFKFFSKETEKKEGK